MAWNLRSDSPEETAAFGCRLGSLLRLGDVVFLRGGLGAGKTCLAQGIATGMGAATARSPSYALVHCYQAVPPLYHADLFRLCAPGDLDPLDLGEAIANGVLVVEWPALAESEFPERLEIELSFVPARENARTIAVASIGRRYGEMIRGLRALVDPGV